VTLQLATGCDPSQGASGLWILSPGLFVQSQDWDVNHSINFLTSTLMTVEVLVTQDEEGTQAVALGMGLCLALEIFPL
jgi:hypothetical protein